MGRIKKQNILIRFFIKIILPVCFIAAGVYSWNYFKSSKIKIKRKPPEKLVIMVETISITPGNYSSWVHAMGVVMPDRQITLKSKVSGEVRYISPDFVQGGVVKKGKLLLKLEDSDYKIEVQKAESILAKAMAGLALEQGSQMIAKEEFNLINKASEEKIVETDLALRKPQLIQANAEVTRAKADLEKAKLNLSRTRITTPFNALVLEKNIDSGSFVTVQGTCGILVDVNNYRVEAKVPQDRLATVMSGMGSGADAIVHSHYAGRTWQGKMVRTTGKTNEKSLMAGVIILVPDPLGLKQGGQPGADPGQKRLQMLLNDHVDVKIKGKSLENVYAVPRNLIKQNNRVWVYNSGALEIKKIDIVWKDESMVYAASGITQRDKIITSDLPVAVNGMRLRESRGVRP